MSLRRATPVLFVLVLGSGCTSAAGVVAPADPAPSSLTTPMSTSISSTSTSTAVAPPVLCAELLDGAEQVHPIGESIVSDFDGDGADDEIWLTPTGVLDMAMLQVVRSSDGAVSEPYELFSHQKNVDQVLAASDLDADGDDEVFYHNGENRRLYGMILDLNDCELRSIVRDEKSLHAPYPEMTFIYGYLEAGDQCAPTGCHYRVACEVHEDGLVELVFTLTGPERQFFIASYDGAADERDGEVWFFERTITVADGRVEPAGIREWTAPSSEIEELVARPLFDCS